MCLPIDDQQVLNGVEHLLHVLTHEILEITRESREQIRDAAAQLRVRMVKPVLANEMLQDGLDELRVQHEKSRITCYILEILKFDDTMRMLHQFTLYAGLEHLGEHVALGRALLREVVALRARQRLADERCRWFGRPR